MYLFQPRLAITEKIRGCLFTFHYVSISTAKALYLSLSPFCNLHSTMYLFQLTRLAENTLSLPIYIPLCIYFNLHQHLPPLSSLSFTFHYVSISTADACGDKRWLGGFTFHYVSISTNPAKTFQMFNVLIFTFHYVSISTPIRS